MKINFTKTAIGKNLFANFYGVGINLINQIILVPFYLTFWGVQKYSDWIILMSLSSFFSISDIGLNTVTSNRFSIKLSEGNKKECTSLLSNNFLLLFIVTIFTLLGTSLYLIYGNIIYDLGIHVTPLSSVRCVFLLLTIQIFIGMFSGVMNAIYRANSLASKSIYLDNTVRLFEALILLGGLVLNLSIEFICILYIFPKLIILIFKHYDIQKIYPYKFRISDCNFSLFKEILFPSFTFMSFPIGNAILLQGFTLIVNKAFGADSLVLYNTTRTMTNFVKTIMGTISNAVWPEFSIAYGKKDFDRMRNIHRYSLISSISISTLISIFLIVCGKSIFNIWTKGEIQFNIDLMIAFIIVLIINNIWYTSSVTLMSTNNHSKLGILYMCSTLLALILAMIVISLFQSLIGTVLSMLIVDIILSYYTIKKSLSITNDSFIRFK